MQLKNEGGRREKGGGEIHRNKNISKNYYESIHQFSTNGMRDLPFLKAVIKQNLLTGKVFSFIELHIIWFSKINSLFFHENNTKKVQVAQLTLRVGEEPLQLEQEHKMIGIVPVFVDVMFRCGKNFYLVDTKFSSSAQQKGCYFVEIIVQDRSSEKNCGIGN